MTQPRIGPPALFDVRLSRSLHDAADIMLASLSPSQRGRHEQLRREVDRVDFVAARALARNLVGQRTGVAIDRIAFRQQCATCAGDDHGPPSVVVDGQAVENVSVSWSHSSGTVAAAVGLRTSVGIDVERTTGPEPEDALLSILVEEDRASVTGAPDRGWAFRDMWVRKEALVKLGVVSLDGALRQPVADILSANPAITLLSWGVPECGAQVGLAVTTS